LAGDFQRLKDAPFMQYSKVFFAACLLLAICASPVRAQIDILNGKRLVGLDGKPIG
jgi:hypothetical protein